MMTLFSKAREVFTKVKIYIQRSMSYMSLINAGLLIFIALNTLQQKGYSININAYGIPIFVGTLVLMILIGWLEVKFGFLKAEQEEYNKENPQIQQLCHSIQKKKRMGSAHTVMKEK